MIESVMQLIRSSGNTTEMEAAVRRLMQHMPRDKYESDVMYFARLIDKILERRAALFPT